MKVNVSGLTAAATYDCERLARPQPARRPRGAAPPSVTHGDVTPSMPGCDGIAHPARDYFCNAGRLGGERSGCKPLDGLPQHRQERATPVVFTHSTLSPSLHPEQGSWIATVTSPPAPPPSPRGPSSLARARVRARLRWCQLGMDVRLRDRVSQPAAWMVCGMPLAMAC